MANQLIIGTGFQKTGTSSLREALQILGYKVGDNNHQMLWPILHGNWSRLKAKALKYDALEDNPWPIIYKELDQHIPNAKFIHCKRNNLDSIFAIYQLRTLAISNFGNFLFW